MAWPSTAGPAHVATALNSNGANIPPCDTPVRNPCDQLQKMDSYVASETTPIVLSMTLSCDGTMVRGRSSLPALFGDTLPIRDLVQPNPFLVIPRFYSKGHFVG